ncbi:MAG: hypothetical protein PW844_19005 [Pantoea sp.]|uniref:hypothetical protein n=1 Tax=Pantoea sp. TaxID=69393 RepID=UPI00239F57D8|nr:hypothetical protein [Pantoea sp.]MDE1188538.1 hypothetical protein [Pantoea sp.]
MKMINAFSWYGKKFSMFLSAEMCGVLIAKYYNGSDLGFWMAFLLAVVFGFVRNSEAADKYWSGNKS